MAISNHCNGKTVSEIGGGLEKHFERSNKTQGKAVAASTHSQINPNLTKFNRVYRFQESKSYKEFLNDLVEKRNENRKAQGLKATRSNANVAITSTIQLSDDTLESLGYNKALSPEYQPEAYAEVVRVYESAIKVLRSDRQRFGDIYSASIHFDESTPHVDVLGYAVDPNDFDFTVRSVLNGDKTAKKGERLSEMQDELASGMVRELGDEFCIKHGIERGEKASEINKRYSSLRKREKELLVKEKETDSKINFAERVTTRMNKAIGQNVVTQNERNQINSAYDEIESENKRLQEANQNLTLRYREIEQKNKRLKELEEYLNDFRNELIGFYQEAMQDIKNAFDSKRLEIAKQKTLEQSEAVSRKKTRVIDMDF